MPSNSKTCKNGNASCPTHWTCDACSAEERDRADRRLTPAQRAYDRWAESRPSIFDGPCAAEQEAPDAE